MSQKFLAIIRQTKNYARITGVILFLLGLLGFAFRSSNSLPDLYLLAFIVFGFWGIMASFLDNSNGTSQ